MTRCAIKRDHRDNEKCKKAQDRLRQSNRIEMARDALNRRFTACGVESEQVHTFRYLGRPLSSTDNDEPAMFWNMRKARKRWALVRRVLTRDGATPGISGMFYKAVAMSVLLYGVETWVLTKHMTKSLEGFHNRVARQISGRQRRLRLGTWVSPPVEEALAIAKLRPMSEYILRRRRYLRDYIQDRPILSALSRADRLTGTPTNTLWWDEQPGAVGDPT